MIKTKLIDMRNWFTLKDTLIAEIEAAGTAAAKLMQLVPCPQHSGPQR